jgi:hypothetical protein
MSISEVQPASVEQPRRYKYEDFSDPQAELPEDAPLEHRVAELEAQVSALKTTLTILEASLQSAVNRGDSWFREQAAETFVSECDAAIKKFRADAVQQALQQAVDAAVEKAFVENGNELGRHIYSQVLKTLRGR